MSYCKWCSKEFAVYDELGAECYSCWQVRHRLENMTDGVVADLVEKNATLVRNFDLNSSSWLMS